MAQLSKKQKAFQLFSEGKEPSSPEVKALGLSDGTRYTYHLEWRKKGQPDFSKGKTPLPGGESLASIIEASPPPPKSQELPQQSPADELGRLAEELGLSDGKLLKGDEGGVKEPKGIEAKTEKVEAAAGVDDGKKPIPTTILGEGLKVTVFLSIGTLALYQIAASMQAQHDGEGELSLGEFLDTCAEDFWRGRGRTLGLITAGGK